MFNVFISVLTAAIIAIIGLLTVKKRFKGEVKFTSKKKLIFVAITVVIFTAVSIIVPILFVKPTVKLLFLMLRNISVFYWTYFAAITDFKLKIIPNEIIIGMLTEVALIFIAEAIFDFSEFKANIASYFLGGAVMGAIFLLGRAISKGGLGMGDVKLIFSCGLMLGFETVTMMTFWALAFSVVCGVVMLIAKKAKLKSKIPMGPFFFAGAVVSNIMYIITGSYGG